MVGAKGETMRLIDADALIAWIKGSQQMTSKMRSLICYIKTMPSCDRPSGEWETVGEKTPYKRCPFCKRVRAFPDTRFCDWCGAKMKGADNDQNIL